MVLVLLFHKFFVFGTCTLNTSNTFTHLESFYFGLGKSDIEDKSKYLQSHNFASNFVESFSAIPVFVWRIAGDNLCLAIESKPPKT